MIMVRTQFTRNKLQTRSISIQFILKKKDAGPVVNLFGGKTPIYRIKYFNSKHSGFLQGRNSTCSSKKIKKISFQTKETKNLIKL